MAPGGERRDGCGPRARGAWIGAAFLGLATLGLVTACGGDDGSASDDDGTTAGDGGDGSSTATTATPGTGGATGDDDGGATAADDGDDGGSDGADTTSEGDDGPPVECSGRPFEGGTHTGLTLDHDGMQRRYDLYVPQTYDGTQAMPLVLNFHGFTSNAGQQTLFSGWNLTAEDHGYVVAYPQGISNSWNGGPLCCGEAASTMVDDVGFAVALVDAIAEQLCIDPSRVYATGMSNGGYMSHRLACEAADVFAAVAPVAGQLGIPEEDCTPSRAVPVLAFHGTEDGLVPYEGARTTMAGWAARNGCSDTPEVTFEQDDVTCETWPDCTDDVEVTLCTAEGAGHCWPGTELCPFGTSSLTMHASDESAVFFSENALP